MITTFELRPGPLKGQSRMKKLSDCISPFSWLGIHIATFFPFVFLFSPSVKELIVVFAIDTLCFVINRPLEARVFKSLYPDSVYYFDGIENLEPNFSEEGKTRLLKSLVEFPQKRASFTYFGSFLKIMPAIGVVVFYWQHEISNAMQFALSIGTCLITMTYFYGAVFLESHLFCSDLVAQLHGRLDFSETFKNFKFVFKKNEFEFHEMLTLLFITIFMFFLQGLIVFSWDNSSKLTLVLKLTLVAFTSLTLFTRIWYLGRSYFFVALEALFLKFRFLDSRQARLILPLHTSPLVGTFEQSFNLLVERLIKREQELSVIISQEAEKGRYQALGEISGLVAHDLSGPLHAAQFWMSEINEQTIAPEERRRLERVRANVEQAMALTLSLRARLKNSDDSPKSVILKDAHLHVIKLLETQFGDYAQGKVEISLDSDLESVELAIPRVDLIQILDNIYRNSLKNLIDNRVVPATIRLSRKNREGGNFSILIADNGSGFTAEKFNRVTAYQLTGVSHEVGSGLGLRLIKRLIEHHCGTLEVVEAKVQGTVLELSLPIVHGVERIPVKFGPLIKESINAGI